MVVVLLFVDVESNAALELRRFTRFVLLGRQAPLLLLLLLILRCCCCCSCCWVAMVLPSRRLSLSLSGPVDDEDGVAGADSMRRNGVLLIIFSAVLRGLLNCTNIAISIVVA